MSLLFLREPPLIDRDDHYDIVYRLILLPLSLIRFIIVSLLFSPLIIFQDGHICITLLLSLILFFLLHFAFTPSLAFHFAFFFFLFTIFFISFISLPFSLLFIICAPSAAATATPRWRDAAAVLSARCVAAPR